MTTVGTTSTLSSSPRRACAVGIAIQPDLLTAPATDLALFAQSVHDAGLDHVSVGDHVSYRGGQGIDGLVAATALLTAGPELHVVVGAFQLALRHPLVAARQLATVTSFAPGRLVLAVGAGGDDPREVSNCGVDPRSRGKRLNESLDVLTRLMRGEVVDHHGAHFDLEQASIATTAPAPPLVVAGSGEAAIERAAAYGSGWLGLLCTPRRYRETRREIVRRTAALGRPAPDWFGLNVWCASAGQSRQELESSLGRWFGPAAPRLLHLCGVGEESQIAAWLADYVAAGATRLSISVPAAEAVEAVERVARLAELLAEQVEDAVAHPDSN
ncbi:MULTISPECIES: LLM class flavin-dependent oxidoreductase [unclassified Streptosporangium]|uniref:LLM class flavin-dependent oxidoreductase n=1 Tax=Streptosporangium sp. NPDC005286 TaxID=3154463 RepID=UPI0033B19F66